MAKCKSCKKRQGRAYVGQMDKIPMELTLGAVGGAMAASKADMVLDKVAFLATNNMVKQAVKIGLGAFLAMQENSYIQGAGIGLIAYAGTTLINTMLPANLGGGTGAGTASGDTTASTSGVYGSGSYYMGTGPVQMAGQNQNYSVLGLGMDQLGTEPVNIGVHQKMPELVVV